MTLPISINDTCGRIGHICWTNSDPQVFVRVRLPGLGAILHGCQWGLVYFSPFQSLMKDLRINLKTWIVWD